MLRLRFLLTLVLLVCPWVYSYGQLHFASVHGERGYAAMRGMGRLDLDNGLILTPSGGYYRMSDSEEDKNGAIAKAALLAEYELTDNFRLAAGASYIPKKLGFQNVGYGIGGRYTLCYRCGILNTPISACVWDRCVIGWIPISAAPRWRAVLKRCLQGLPCWRAVRWGVFCCRHSMTK